MGFLSCFPPGQYYECQPLYDVVSSAADEMEESAETQTKQTRRQLRDLVWSWFILGLQCSEFCRYGEQKMTKPLIKAILSHNFFCCCLALSLPDLLLENKFGLNCNV